MKNDTHRTSSFTAYLTGRTAHMQKLVKLAVSTVDAGKYLLITDYCKTVGMVVSELRIARASDPNSPYYGKKVYPFSYVTLLRNTAYRNIVDDVFERSRGVTVLNASDNSEDLMLLVASLQAQVNLLKERIVVIDTGSYVPENDDVLVSKLNQRIGILLRVNQDIVNSVKGAFRTEYEPTLDRPVPGMYGPKGLVATIDDLEEMAKTAREHPHGS